MRKEEKRGLFRFFEKQLVASKTPTSTELLSVLYSISASVTIADRKILPEKIHHNARNI
jgi:hypothetical protein